MLDVIDGTFLTDSGRTEDKEIERRVNTLVAIDAVDVGLLFPEMAGGRGTGRRKLSSCIRRSTNLCKFQAEDDRHSEILFCRAFSCR